MAALLGRCFGAMMLVVYARRITDRTQDGRAQQCHKQNGCSRPHTHQSTTLRRRSTFPITETEQHTFSSRPSNRRSSVGWLGAVLAFLALAVIGFTTEDEVKVRGAYLLMAPAAWFVLVPLAHASLLSGIVLSLGTSWGLFRHYWVVLKLGITVFATVMSISRLE